MLTRQPHGSLTIDIPTASPTNPFTEKTTEALRTRILTQQASMTPKVFRKLLNSQQRYEHYFDQNVRTLPKFHSGQMINVDSPPLATLPTEFNAANFNKLLIRSYGPFQILHVTKHILTVGENRIPNIISIDRTRNAPVEEIVEHPNRLKA